MNIKEKKALYKFLVIYIGSSMLLILAMFYFYYINEKKSIDDYCDMEMKNAAYKIKQNILTAYMNKKEIDFSQNDALNFKFALYDKNQILIYSILDKDVKINLNKEINKTDDYSYYVAYINDKNIPIHYIIVQTSTFKLENKNLLIFLFISFCISTLFIIAIGYFLSQLLLQPVREKLIQMDKFIKDTAHELNTPVSVLLTSVSTLKEGRSTQKMLNYISSSAKQISLVYNDIHYSAFIDGDDSLNEELDLKDLLNESADFYLDIAKAKNIVITKDLSSCIVQVDRTKMQKLINNLLSNAIKYSQQGSEVIVSLSNNILSVQDYGIGISKEDQENIFKRYERGKNNNNQGGFGIGLDIVSRVVIDYELQMSLNSKVDEGTCFNIDLNNITIEKKEI